MSQHVVVTGANRGIGLAFVHAYLQQGDTVTAVCRSTSEALQNTAAQVVTGVDVAEASSLVQLQQALGGRQVDILVNNAGVLHSDALGDLDYANMHTQMEINAFGPLRVTEAVLGNLVAGSKIALITSRMGSIADNSSGGYYGYRMSKAALNAAGKSLSRDLHRRKIAVALLHPGYVQTAMVNHGGDISAEVAAARLVARIDQLSLENSGSLWHSNGELLPW